MVVGTHHMLLSIHKVLLGATCHATGDVLPLNSLEPHPCAVLLEKRDPRGGAHRGAGLASGHRVTAVALLLASSRSKPDRIFRCPLTQSGDWDFFFLM